jgi:hypothetical protein
MVPAAASPPTALTDEDIKRHPLGKKAFRWRQQQNDFDTKLQLYWSYWAYKNSEDYTMMKIITTIPLEIWHLWDKTAGIEHLPYNAGQH